jgi:hypothetical protein
MLFHNATGLRIVPAASQFAYLRQCHRRDHARSQLRSQKPLHVSIYFQYAFETTFWKSSLVLDALDIIDGVIVERRDHRAQVKWPDDIDVKKTLAVKIARL